MNEVRLLWRDGPGRGPVVAVCDVFGKAYHVSHRPRRVGEVVRSGVQPARGPRVEVVYRVLSVRVSKGTLAPLLRRSMRPRAAVADGFWYEVIAD
ncbi:MAG: hypothetical protein LAQ69_22390 [Acidobacteriia bacterium]|nr:hypothetical protein [Terriglobia bacterium]